MSIDAHDPASEEALGCTRNAIYLGATQARLLALTPCQREVFRRLCSLQMDDAGPHALLPNVVAAFLAVAGRPWWDRGVAGLIDEPATRPRR